MSRAGLADHLERERDVLGDGLVGQQAEVLEDGADLAAQPRHLPAGEPVEVLAGDVHAATRRAGLAEHQPQGGRLAGAGLAHEEDELALLDVDAHLVERRLARSGVGLADLLEPNHVDREYGTVASRTSAESRRAECQVDRGRLDRQVRSASTTHQAAYAGSQSTPSPPASRTWPPSASYGVVRPAARSWCRWNGPAVVGDVVEADEDPAGVLADHGENAVVGVLQHRGRRRGVQLREPGADPGQVRQPREDPAGHGPQVVPGGRAVPVEPGPVRPAVVVLVALLGRPAGVVGLGELVAAPDHGDPAPARGDRVRQEDPGLVVARPAAARRSPLIRWSPVSGLAWKTSPSAQEPGNVPAYQSERKCRCPGPVDAGGVRVGVVDGPADVVVAAGVGDPGAGAGRRRQRSEGLPGQDRVAGREHRPGLHHEAVVVGEVADPSGVAAGAEVLHQVARPHDRLGLERHRRRRHPRHRVQRLGERVHLGLVLAAGAHPLPEEGDRVEPEHLDAEVGQPQDDLGELGQHGWVGPVEVPLPLVERRPDPALELVVPGEAAGREVGEHLGQGPLVLVGQLAVGEDVEVVAVRATRRRRPGRAPPSRARGRRG